MESAAANSRQTGCRRGASWCEVEKADGPFMNALMTSLLAIGPDTFPSTRQQCQRSCTAMQAGHAPASDSAMLVWGYMPSKHNTWQHSNAPSRSIFASAAPSEPASRMPADLDAVKLSAPPAPPEHVPTPNRGSGVRFVTLGKVFRLNGRPCPAAWEIQWEAALSAQKFAHRWQPEAGTVPAPVAELNGNRHGGVLRIPRHGAADWFGVGRAIRPTIHARPPLLGLGAQLLGHGAQRAATPQRCLCLHACILRHAGGAGLLGATPLLPRLRPPLHPGRPRCRAAERSIERPHVRILPVPGTRSLRRRRSCTRFTYRACRVRWTDPSGRAPDLPDLLITWRLQPTLGRSAV